MNTRDIAGQRFGRLVAIERTDQRHGNCFLWRCKCDCGNECLVNTFMLTHGLTKSCGCLWHEPKNDLSGRRFGRLEAIRLTDKKGHRGMLWECRCDCGKIILADRWSLISGQKLSCGCLHNDLACEHVAKGRAKNLIEGTHIGAIKKNTVFKNSASGVRGVTWDRRRQKWQARLQFKGKMYNLGHFDKLEDAAAARKEAEEKYYKPFLEQHKK